MYLMSECINDECINISFSWSFSFFFHGFLYIWLFWFDLYLRASPSPSPLVAPLTCRRKSWSFRSHFCSSSVAMEDAALNGDKEYRFLARLAGLKDWLHHLNSNMSLDKCLTSFCLSVLICKTGIVGTSKHCCESSKSNMCEALRLAPST